MTVTMEPEARVLVQKMLKGLVGEPLVPPDVANAGFHIMCLALSKMDDAQREERLAQLEAAARTHIFHLLGAREPMSDLKGSSVE
jgi:hypothetical protein